MMGDRKAWAFATLAFAAAIGVVTCAGAAQVRIDWRSDEPSSANPIVAGFAANDACCGFGSRIGLGGALSGVPRVLGLENPAGLAEAAGGDSDYFQTGIAGKIMFGGDGDMFLTVNGEAVGQAGAIHARNAAKKLTVNAGPGDYLMDLFYADRHRVGAYAYVTITGITADVPEPSTWAMMLTGFAGLGFAAFRYSRKASVSIA